MNRPVFSDGVVHVMPSKCSTCIFKPGNLMDLDPGRVKDMRGGALANDSVIPCHHTLPFHTDDRDQQAACRGYYDSVIGVHPVLECAQRLDIIKEVPPA